MSKDFNQWLSTFRESIANYTYYVDFKTVYENFEDIKITTDTADIQLVLSDDQSSFVVCEEEMNAKHSVTVTENTLQIKVDDNKKWYEDIGINLNVPKITVYLGKSEYGNISLETDTGNVSLNNIFLSLQKQ